MSRSSLIAAALAGGIALSAQQQEPQPPQPPVFRAEANLVRVDVTVVDRHGEPVTTLTAENFAVEEDGIPQTVQSFKFVTADGRPAVDDDASLPIRSREHAAAEAARDDVRVFVIFWDEYHIGRMAEAIKGRRALTTFVTTAFGPSDLVALMDPLLPVDALKFTRDRRELADKIAKLEGRFGIYMPTRSAAEDNMLERRDIAKVRSEVTVSALQSAAVHLGSIKEGRKSIIFVSEGLTGLGMDQMTVLRELTETANTNNTAIYTLDPSGLNGGVSDILRTIAENTGAEAFVNTNTPERGLRQVVREASAFYLLGYTSTRNPQDGKFHKIGVKLKRSGFDLRARRGYWAPNATEIEKARTEAAAAEAVPADLTAAVSVLATAREDRLADVWAGAARGADGHSEVTIAWTPRPSTALGTSSAPGRRDTARRVSIGVKGAGGDRSFEAPYDAGRFSFPSPPGALQLQVTLRDADGNILDEDRRPFAAPDFTTGSLTIATPMVIRARTPAAARAAADWRDAAVFAGREFNRTDHVFVRFEAYGAAAPHAAISASLANKAGATLLDLPVQKRNSESESAYQVEVPMASIARGDYVITVAAQHGDEKTRAVVPLRVLSF